MADMQRPRREMYPSIDENEMALSEDGLKNCDIEAQKDESVASTIPEESPTSAGGTLRPPHQPRMQPGT